MRVKSLGETLRALVLATPFVGATACGPGVPSGGVPCTNTVTFAVASLDAGTSATHECSSLCAVAVPFGLHPDAGCSFTPLDDGGAGVVCSEVFACGGTGRRPAGLLAYQNQPCRHPVGALFAEAARLEAASVVAFRVLARELALHGAPSSLVQAAKASAQDEVRHTRATRALARRYGVTPTPPAFGPAPAARSLEAIARETYGAVVALWQARYAQDAAVVAALAPIARDETRHAVLSWAIAAWANTLLSPGARNRIAAAHADALAELALARPVEPALVALAGLPSTESAVTLARGVAAATA